MFYIEQAKIYREPKFGSDRGVWWLNYREIKMSTTCLINMGAPCWCTIPLWYTNMAAKNTMVQIKPNFNQNGQI